jgi:hypothetical protein
MPAASDPRTKVIRTRPTLAILFASGATSLAILPTSAPSNVQKTINVMRQSLEQPNSVTFVVSLDDILRGQIAKPLRKRNPNPAWRKKNDK